MRGKFSRGFEASGLRFRNDRDLDILSLGVVHCRRLRLHILNHWSSMVSQTATVKHALKL